MSDRFKGKKVLVTGGSSGIGYATALMFAQEGADVAITYNTKSEVAQRVVTELQKLGGKAYAHQIDFSKADSKELATVITSAVVALGGELDILVNNAGMIVRKEFEDVTEEDFDTSIAVNTKAPFFLMQAVAARWSESKKEGSIITVGSISTQLMLKGLSVYEISKAGAERAARSAALALARYGIHSNIVAPGLIKTELNQAVRRNDPEQWSQREALIPAGRAGTPDEVAKAILAFAELKFVNGARVVVDGGQTDTIIPRARM